MISDIVSRYRSRGLRGRELRRALKRHAAILSGCDPDDADALMARASRIHVATPELEAPREEWASYDRLLGIGDEP